MKTNVGSYDGAARFVLGSAFILVAHHYHSWWALLGLLPILSSMFGYCLVYAALGIDTTACDKKKAP